MSDQVFLSVVLLEVALAFSFYSWFEELWSIYEMRKVYFLVTIAAIKWTFFIGSRSYSVWWYKTSNNELGDVHEIEFPAIWM